MCIRDRLYPFFQAVLDWSGLLATLGLMPMAILMMGFSGLAPLVAKRVGPRATLATGVLLGGAAVSYTHLDVYKRQAFAHRSECSRPARSGAPELFAFGARKCEDLSDQRQA